MHAGTVTSLGLATMWAHHTLKDRCVSTIGSIKHGAAYNNKAGGYQIGMMLLFCLPRKSGRNSAVRGFKITF